MVYEFHHEVEAEQWKLTGKCIYHLSKSHTAADCSVKKDCYKLKADKQDGTSHSSPTVGLTGHDDTIDASIEYVSITLLMKKIWSIFLYDWPLFTFS